MVFKVNKNEQNTITFNGCPVKRNFSIQNHEIVNVYRFDIEILIDFCQIFLFTEIIFFLVVSKPTWQLGLVSWNFIFGTYIKNKKYDNWHFSSRPNDKSAIFSSVRKPASFAKLLQEKL